MWDFDVGLQIVIIMCTHLVKIKLITHSFPFSSIRLQYIVVMFSKLDAEFKQQTPRVQYKDN